MSVNYNANYKGLAGNHDSHGFMGLPSSTLGFELTNAMPSYPNQQNGEITSLQKTVILVFVESCFSRMTSYLEQISAQAMVKMAYL